MTSLLMTPDLTTEQFIAAGAAITGLSNVCRTPTPDTAPQDGDQTLPTQLGYGDQRTSPPTYEYETSQFPSTWLPHLPQLTLPSLRSSPSMIAMMMSPLTQEACYELQPLSLRWLSHTLMLPQEPLEETDPFPCLAPDTQWATSLLSQVPWILTLIPSPSYPDSDEELTPSRSTIMDDHKWQVTPSIPEGPTTISRSLQSLTERYLALKAPLLRTSGGRTSNEGSRPATDIYANPWGYILPPIEETPFGPSEALTTSPCESSQTKTEKSTPRVPGTGYKMYDPETTMSKGSWRRPSAPSQKDRMSVSETNKPIFELFHYQYP
ncbi:hypothetical protein ARMGADRAFT_1084308 [Armillaria gallica]|uniref:Uncharacterized protein n=1 Tax=Armillaria gallica TaxID=47427 RepID=A0A2H3D3U0_ARMGA|nr:hypothetical protein ARMGADRAFT_1084308 [Armillaria gallica]